MGKVHCPVCGVGLKVADDPAGKKRLEERQDGLDNAHRFASVGSRGGETPRQEAV